MPKVLPEYLELRRQQILDAAAVCFSRSGFHQTTMQDICAEADLSPGAVYRYFRSKEEIIQAMCLRGQAEDAEAIRNVLNLGNTQQILDELVRMYFEGADDRELCALNISLLAETRRDPFVLASVREGMASIREPLAQVIRDAQAKGEMKPSLDPEAMSRVMLGLYQGLVCQKIVEPELDVKPYAAAVKAIFAGVYVDEKVFSVAGARGAPALQH
jgi:AcrR family transcriptional regulator